jgi:Histidine kinase-, DNA gyrase B-, and HSP90-like ATPase
MKKSLASIKPMKTIKAKVSQKGISKVHLFFNNSPQTLLSEVLQNCRRAKASKVSITTKAIGEYTKVTIEDNGIGIQNPDILLHLWDSDWDQETQGLESPAGLGFFSLCNLPGGVEVKSNGWETHITEDVFKGVGEATINDSEAFKNATGTSLSFTLKLEEDRTLSIIRLCLRYYPIPAFVNKKPVEQKGFLDGANYIHECPGGRIGVYLEESLGYEDINFYGVQIPHTDLVPRNWNRLSYRREDPKKETYSVRVDILDNKILDLVLPARDKIVENDKLHALKIECRKAVYNYIQSKGSHNLPFESYTEAKDFGIEIPEATPLLSLLYPLPLHTTHRAWGSLTAKNYGNIQPDEIKDLVPNGIICDVTRRAEIGALHIPGEEIPFIFRKNHEMEGYSWYPKKELGEVTQILSWEAPKKTIKLVLNENSDNYDSGTTKFEKLDNRKKKDHPNKITLVAEVIDNEGNVLEEFSLETVIAFQPDYFDSDAVYSKWIPSRNPKAKEEIDPDLLYSLYFSPYEDSDSDSYETQEEAFYMEAESAIISVMKSEEEAALYDITQRINTWEIKNAFRQLKAKELIIKLDKNGEIAVKYPKKTK